MFVRIVKMSFKPTATESFLELFDKNKDQIRGFPGCHFLELYREKQQPNIFFTYSYWEDEAALEQYRTSEVFQEIWGQTKIHFSARPEAWSVDKVVSLE